MIASWREANAIAPFPDDRNVYAIDGQAATIKARWICEQAHQQMKEELGLDHFEGRSWQGLHRHALMTMIAYASSNIAGSQQQDGKKESTGRRLNRPCRGPRHPRIHRSATTATMPALPKMDLQRAAA